VSEAAVAHAATVSPDHGSTLSVRDLGVTLGRTTLVEHVSFDVGAGEILGIVGETGAGKTLTVKSLLGLLPSGMQSRGTVAFGAGDPIDLARPGSLRLARGRDIGIVLQNPVGMFDPLIKLRHQLIEGVVRRRLQRRDEATLRARELVGAMGFPDPDQVLELYPHELSGGMAQRMGIAMALMPRPEVVVTDEPTSALDAHLRIEVLRLLSALARDEGTAVLVVSHDLGLVSHFSTALTVMYAGRIVEQGATLDVLQNPQHPYTLALRECSTALDAEPRVPLRVISGSPPVPGAWPPGCVFSPRCPLVFDRCVDERPALRVRERRAAACHLAFGGDR
jgi:oligopeptide/dipeptide ABC transporter ATP-binding protein